jgi:predicted TIM-barrel fold metal-dependent hydrolase
MKKSDPRDPAEELPESPIPFHPSSNGEFEPRLATDRDRRAAAMYRGIVDEKSRRLGMSRREFTESASGMVAALFVLNEVYGCGADPKGGNRSGDRGGGGFSRDAGFDVDQDVGPEDAAQANADARYDASDAAIEDAARGDPMLTGQELIFDVQTHTTVPAPPWNASTCNDASPMLCPTAYLSGLFVDSDTSVACLSGYPGPRQNDRPSIQARGRIKEIVDRLGGSPRLVIHANVRPDEGLVELDAMAEDAQRFPVAGWKTYPPQLTGNGLDSDRYGRPFLERARETGIRVIASHRGIGDDRGAWNGRYSPQDVVAAAKAAPDLKFLIYHSGWQSGVAEDHPFNMAEAAPRGIDRLIKALLDAGLGPNSNVYAELGTTWFSLMSNMSQAAHALGKLLKYLGPDRVLWGTDSYNNGGPQAQIAAFRAFEIPQSMQDMYGYPALSADVKRKIFGLNGAAVYGVDPAVIRPKITQDQIDAIKLARLEDPRRFPRGPRTHGPRTRREYLAFLRWSGEG